MNEKMQKSRNVGFSFGVISILLLVVSLFAGVSAATTEMITVDSLEINGVLEDGSEDIAVIAGEKTTITMVFTAIENASNVRLRARLEGEKVDVEKEVFVGDLESGKRYTRTFAIDVPYELKNQVSDDLSLFIQIWNSDYRTVLDEVVLRVQRESYNVQVMSINTKNNVEAGEIFPVQVVLKNTGYNDLDDLYVTAQIPSLDVKKVAYFGDIPSVETNDDKDTVSGTLYLQVPYNVKSGDYSLEIRVKNEDLDVSENVQIRITNDLYHNVIVVDSRKTAAVGEDAQYEIVVANPTNSLKVYRIVTQSTSVVESSVSEGVIAVSAGTSKTVRVYASANVEGEHEFSVDVLSGEELISSNKLTLNAEGTAIANPIVVLTIVLAIIFLVLLGVLVVLITKKPKKTDEYGESYY